MKLWKLFLFLFLLYLPWQVKAVGVSIEPSSINIVFPDKHSASLDIKNISDEPVLVKIEADHFRENIKINNQEMELLPEQAARVNFDLDFSAYPTGVKNTYISVVTQPLNRQSFNASSGIKIPLTVNISYKKWQWSAPAVFVVLFISLITLVLLLQGVLSFLDRPKKKENIIVNLLHHHKKPWWKKF